MWLNQVLTDVECTNPACKTPTLLLRAPKGQNPSMLCVGCDSHTADLPSKATTESFSSHVSGISTPPTELSEAPPSPTWVPPPVTAETLQRRAQSDMASREIGNRMLKGWAMLADECPSPGCYAIPLVRPPKSVTGVKDPKKECVVCGTVYVDAQDASGWVRLEPLPRAKDAKTAPSKSDLAASQRATMYNKGKARQPEEIPAEPAFPLPHVGKGAWDVPLTSLEKALVTLSAKLDHVCGAGTAVDHEAVSKIASAISKVTETMLIVKKLRMEEASAL